jgi:hypothetical protein
MGPAAIDSVAIGLAAMDPAAILDHQFRVAAYVVTWVIQLSYLAFLGVKWWSMKRELRR